jgi:predicted TIM-barrel fold metal-dependent hydrolase
VGPGRILYASDFPHERDPPEFLGDVAKLVARADLSDTEKRMILFENANRFYRLGVD